MRVPLADLGDHLSAYVPTLHHLVRDGAFVGGSTVRAFEKAWARTAGAARCVGVNSGTDALTLTLRAWARRAPDRDLVVVPATSFVATFEAVVNAGLRPWVCDVTEDGLLDLAQLHARTGIHGDYRARVLAVVPVHLYGQVADVMEPGPWRVLEDACQAHGARYPNGTPVGAHNPTAWSFMPAKILGAWGDAGAVTFPAGGGKDEEDVRRLANHGRSAHNEHEAIGTNSRLDALQAAVLTARLRRLSYYNVTRTALAARYAELLPGDLRLQPNTPGRVWAYYACWTRGNERDALVAYLRARGVQTGLHYPYSLSSAVRGHFAGDATPVADRLARTTLTLPLWPGMTEEQQAYVVREVRAFYGGGGA